MSLRTPKNGPQDMNASSTGLWSRLVGVAARVSVLGMFSFPSACDQEGAASNPPVDGPAPSTSTVEEFAECRRLEEESAAAQWDATQAAFAEEDAALFAEEERAYAEWLERTWQEYRESVERYEEWARENPPTASDRLDRVIGYLERYVAARAHGVNAETALRQAAAQCDPERCGIALFMFAESPSAVRKRWNEEAERALRHWTNATTKVNKDAAEAELVPWGGHYEIIGINTKAFMPGTGLDYRLVFHDLRAIDAWLCVLQERRPDGDVDRVPECRNRLERKAETGQSRCPPLPRADGG